MSWSRNLLHAASGHGANPFVPPCIAHVHLRLHRHLQKSLFPPPLLHCIPFAVLQQNLPKCTSARINTSPPISALIMPNQICVPEDYLAILDTTAVLSSQLLLRSRHSYLHSSLLRCLLCNPQMPSNLQAPSAIQRANSVVGRGGYPSRAFQDDPFFILLPYCRRPLVPASAILHCGFYCVSSIAASGVINCRCRRGG